MHHQEEWLVTRALLDEFECQVGDDIGGIAAGIGLFAGRRVEHRIPIGSLTGEDLPAVEAGRIASEVPFPDHPGVVAALLEQPGDGRARAVEAVKTVTPLTGSTPRQIAARRGEIALVERRRQSGVREQAVEMGGLVARDPYARLACAAWSSS